MAGKTFTGNLRIAKVDSNGVVTGGYIGLLNSVKCELVVPAPDNIDQISNLNESAGQLKSRGQRPKPTTLNISIDDLDDQRVLAYALNGTVAAYAQASATVTAESVTVGKLGDWVPFAHRNVSTVVLKDSADAITYVLGTDYLLDAAPGFFLPLVGGAMTAGETLHAGYSAGAVAGSSVQIATVPSVLLRVHVQLRSLVDGSTSYFIVPIFQASSSGNQDLFGKNMLVAAMSGAMFLPPQGTAAFSETGGAPSIITTITAP